MKKYSLKLDELATLAKEISKEFKSGVVILQGDLAAGKTTLVKAATYKKHINKIVIKLALIISSLLKSPHGKCFRGVNVW